MKTVRHTAYSLVLGIVGITLPGLFDIQPEICYVYSTVCALVLFLYVTDKPIWTKKVQENTSPDKDESVDVNENEDDKYR